MAGDCDANPYGLLVQLADRLRAFMDETAAAEGLTAQQVELVMALDEPRQMSQLAEHKVCDPSSVTAMVKRLERGGFVERLVAADDRRARLVRLTPKGRRVRARLQARLGDAGQIIDALDDGQRRALAGLFGADRVAP